MVAEKIRVLVVDDSPFVPEGIGTCLNRYSHIHVIGIARNGDLALELAQQVSPDVAIMDIKVPVSNGTNALQIFIEQCPDVKLLILSRHNRKEYITTAMAFGARGYILKNAPPSEIATAIKAVHCGGIYFSYGVSHPLFQEHDCVRKIKPLTSREQSILLALARGKSNKEVAWNFDLSVRTVETHRKNIKRKLGISSTAGLTRYAIETGLMPLETEEV